MSLLRNVMSRYPGQRPSWQFENSISNVESFAKHTSQDPEALFWELVGLSEEDVTELIRGCTIIANFNGNLAIVYDGIV